LESPPKYAALRGGGGPERKTKINFLIVCSRRTWKIKGGSTLMADKVTAVGYISGLFLKCEDAIR